MEILEYMVVLVMFSIFKISAPKVKRLQISLELDELSSRDIDGFCRTFIDANACSKS